MSPLTEKERDAIEVRRASTRVAIIVAVLAALPPTIAALAAWSSTRETHVLVNSQLTEFKALLKEQSDARSDARDKEKK